MPTRILLILATLCATNLALCPPSAWAISRRGTTPAPAVTPSAAAAAQPDLVDRDPCAPEEWYDSRGRAYTHWPQALRLPVDDAALPQAIADLLLDEEGIRARSPHLWSHLITDTIPNRLFRHLDAREMEDRKKVTRARTAASKERLWVIFEKTLAVIVQSASQHSGHGAYRDADHGVAQRRHMNAFTTLVALVTQARLKQEAQDDVAYRLRDLRISETVSALLLSGAGAGLVYGALHILVGNEFAESLTALLSFGSINILANFFPPLHDIRVAAILERAQSIPKDNYRDILSRVASEVTARAAATLAANNAAILEGRIECKRLLVRVDTPMEADGDEAEQEEAAASNTKARSLRR